MQVGSAGSLLKLRRLAMLGWRCMDANQLSTLLWQNESETLDFKRDQYPFDSGTDEDRSELLKDILAFANAWRTSAAHILIGVQEVKGGRALVIGTQQLLNRTLQTFVQSKVNRPITFFYEPVDFQEKSIGVVTIPVQDRPFFLIKNFGRLTAETVYIRRGDTTSTANPDEVAQMGAKLEGGRAQPVLEFAFVDLEKRSKLGSHPLFQTLSLDVPEDAEIPAFGNSYGLMSRINDENEDFYSDLAIYLRDVTHLQALGVTVANTSRVTAQQVVVRLGFEQPEVEVKSSGERAAEPVREHLMKMLRPDALMRSDVSVTPHERGVEVQIELGDIQPGTSAWSNRAFYLGRRTSGEVHVSISISGHNIAEPVQLSGMVTFEVDRKDVSVDQLGALGDNF
jgi:hypothetical protein